MDKYVVIGKVRHNQRMNDPPLPVWIICTSSGSILSAHCMECKVRLRETCSHVASILYYVECWAKIHVACTQVKCAWHHLLYAICPDQRDQIQISLQTKARYGRETIDGNIPAGNNCKPATQQNLKVPGVSPTDGEPDNLMEQLIWQINNYVTPEVMWVQPKNSFEPEYEEEESSSLSTAEY